MMILARQFVIYLGWFITYSIPLAKSSHINTKPKPLDLIDLGYGGAWPHGHPTPKYMS